MSNNKKQKHGERDVFMNISNNLTDETYMLKVPYSFRFVLDDLGNPEKEIVDFHNSREMLLYFCELFCAASHKKRNTFEMVINSPALKLDKITDLITTFLELHKYYVLKISSNRELGEFHIVSAKRNDPDSWIAKSDLKDAKIVGQKVKNIENGYFTPNGFYVGKYHFFAQADD